MIFSRPCVVFRDWGLGIMPWLRIRKTMALKKKLLWSRYFFKFLEWNLILEFGASDNQVGMQVEFPFLTKQNIAQRFSLKDELFSVSFCSSLSAWIKTLLCHSGHCWIPYLWEKLLETFRFNRTYLAELFFLSHPFCCPLLEATKMQLLKAPPHFVGGKRCPPQPQVGKGQDQQITSRFACSIHVGCLQLVSQLVVSLPGCWRDLSFHGSKTKLVSRLPPLLLCLCYTASPFLTLHPVFH